MKFTINKSVLLRELTIAQDIISARNAMSILSNVMLELNEGKLTIKASDLKVNFVTTVNVQQIEPGTTTIFCDKLLNVVKNLPESEIEFIKDDNIVKIKPVGQKIDFKLRCMSSDNYPEIGNIDDSLFTGMAESDFIKMINSTIFAVSDDETRYFLNGIYFDGQRMVSTDGRRLSYIENTNYPISLGVIVPTKILNLVKKLSYGEGNIKVAVEGKNIHIKLGNQYLSSSLIDGQFPQYSRITSESPNNTAVVNREKLLNAIRRVSLLSDGKSKRIFISLSDDKITLSSEENEIGNAIEEFEVDYSGPSVKLAVNFTYIVEPLKSMSGEEIQFCFTDSARPIMIYSTPKTEFLHMIQPMQVD